MQLDLMSRQLDKIIKSLGNLQPSTSIQAALVKFPGNLISSRELYESIPLSRRLVAMHLEQMGFQRVRKAGGIFWVRPSSQDR